MSSLGFHCLAAPLLLIIVVCCTVPRGVLSLDPEDGIGRMDPEYPDLPQAVIDDATLGERDAKYFEQEKIIEAFVTTGAEIPEKDQVEMRIQRLIKWYDDKPYSRLRFLNNVVNSFEQSNMLRRQDRKIEQTSHLRGMERFREQSMVYGAYQDEGHRVGDMYRKAGNGGQLDDDDRPVPYPYVEEVAPGEFVYHPYGWYPPTTPDPEGDKYEDRI